jgi:hypothetical protein
MISPTDDCMSRFVEPMLGRAIGIYDRYGPLTLAVYYKVSVMRRWTKSGGGAAQNSSSAPDGRGQSCLWQEDGTNGPTMTLQTCFVCASNNGSSHAAADNNGRRREQTGP